MSSKKTATGKKSSATSKSSNSTKQQLSVAETPKVPIIEPIADQLATVEYVDDYRMLLMNYDPAKNKTSPEMTKYEKALIIGKRATQIAQMALPLIDVPPRMTSAIEIAEEELRQKMTPFIVMRDLGNSKKEIWKIRDMKIM